MAGPRTNDRGVLPTWNTISSAWIFNAIHVYVVAFRFNSESGICVNGGEGEDLGFFSKMSIRGWVHFVCVDHIACQTTQSDRLLLTKSCIVALHVSLPLQRRHGELWRACQPPLIRVSMLEVESYPQPVEMRTRLQLPTCRRQFAFALPLRVNSCFRYFCLTICLNLWPACDYFASVSTHFKTPSSPLPTF